MPDPDPAATAAAGRLGFDAYNAAMGGKSFYYGLPLMDWDDLAPEVQQAWNAAANAIEAKARAAERRHIRQLAIERRAIFIEYQEGLPPFVGDFADLLDGDDGAAWPCGSLPTGSPAVPRCLTRAPSPPHATLPVHRPLTCWTETTVTERELTGEVMKLCDELGLLYHHCPNSSRCKGPKGFPDLVVAGEHGVIFAELKSEDGDNSAQQDLWAWTLNRIDNGRFGQQVTYLQWRPHNLSQGVTISDWLHLIATGIHK